MERRCRFMENFPGYCYNIGNVIVSISYICCNFHCIYVGIGDKFDHSHLTQYELKKMLDDKEIKKVQENYYTNTEKLGEAIMETMLQEVSDFCRANIQQNQAMQAHQQVNEHAIKIISFSFIFAKCIIVRQIICSTCIAGLFVCMYIYIYVYKKFWIVDCGFEP